MAYVYAGTRMRYVATWNETGILLWTSGVSDILNQVTADLQNQYQLRVERSDVQAPAIAVGTLTETISLDLYSGQDRNDVSDIIGNVNDAFARYGTAPDAADITSLTPPAAAPAGTPSGSTGAPGPTPATTSSSALDWWTTLKTEATAGSMGFVVGAVAVVGLLVFLAVKAEV